MIEDLKQQLTLPSALMNRLLFPINLIWFLVMGLSACVPVIRTEYLSPSWQGTLVDIQTGEPLTGIEVTDLYTSKKVKTNQQGYFELPPATSEFSFKLPAASMAGVYQIEVALPNNSIRFSGRRLAANTEPSEFDLEVFPLQLVANTPAFLLESRDGYLPLPQHFIDDCGAPMQNAISLAHSARLYKILLDKQQNLGPVTITKKDAESAYHWALNSWGDASEICFRQNYTQSKAFEPFIKLFFDEAQEYQSTNEVNF